MPPFVVYHTSDAVSENQQFIGFFVMPSGKFFGVRFNGKSEDALRETAATWWTEETARQAKLKGGRAEPITDFNGATRSEPEVQVEDEFEGLL